MRQVGFSTHWDRQAEISKIERGVIDPRSGALAKLARGLDAQVTLLANVNVG